MKILIFGGTTEGRILAERLPGSGHEVTVSVATELGLEELQGSSCEKVSGRLSAEEMAELARRAELVIDATHPYAAEASRNIRLACRKCGVSLRRVLREPSGPADEHPAGTRETAPPAGMGDSVLVESCREAAEYLREREGNVLVTTGSKELPDYRILQPERLFVRVLPTHEALDTCERLGIPHRNILALQGPFSEEMNRAMIRQYDIRFLVSKDGGEYGGFTAKRKAAEAEGAEVILIRRPEDAGISLEELLEELRVKQ